MATSVYTQLGLPIAWKASGGDEVIDLGTADGDSGAVCVGAYHQWPADPRPTTYLWYMDISGFDVNNTVGETVDLYVTESEDGTLWTGPEAPSDSASGAGNVDRLKNLLYVGSAVVRSTTAADNLTASGVVSILARNFAPVVHNNTSQKLQSTGDAHELRFYPVYDEAQ